jgi:hypothetical protein
VEHAEMLDFVNNVAKSHTQRIQVS